MAPCRGEEPCTNGALDFFFFFFFFFFFPRFFVSRVFAPAPGSAARKRVANLNRTTPFAKPQGRATQFLFPSLQRKLVLIP